MIYSAFFYSSSRFTPNVSLLHVFKLCRHSSFSFLFSHPPTSHSKWLHLTEPGYAGGFSLRGNFSFPSLLVEHVIVGVSSLKLEGLPHSKEATAVLWCIFPFSSIDRQPFMLTFTPMVSLEVSFNLTKCMFWGCGGSHSTQRQITQPDSWWLQTQDGLAVRQQTSQLMTWTCWGNNDHTNTICFMCIRLPPSHIFSLVDFFFPSSSSKWDLGLIKMDYSLCEAVIQQRQMCSCLLIYPMPK